MNCVCGEHRLSEQHEHDGFWTNDKGISVKCKFPVGTCEKCGLMRHLDLPFSDDEEYARYYADNYPPGKPSYEPRRYANDLHNYGKKYKQFGLKAAKRLLDVGCGSGALVEIARNDGIDACGCELLRYSYAPDNPDIYFRRFEDVHFPTDHFDAVVSCDVVEHVLDPVAFVRELFRVTSQEGRCYVEIPLFFHKLGYHHWKKNEHLWYFDQDRFEGWMTDAGFEIVGRITTDVNKIVIVGRKPKQTRTTFLLPPGIGDVYWPLTKMQSLMEREGIEPPVDVYVAAPRAKVFDSHKRAFPFLKMFPFLHSMDAVRFNHGDPVWKEAYLKQGRTVFRNVLKCDYFITWNGHVRAGKTLDEIDPDIKCQWDLPRFVSLREEEYRKHAIETYGNYIVLYWVFTGTNGTILEHISVKDIARAVIAVTQRTGAVPVLVGAAWDKRCPMLAKLKQLIGPDLVDLRGQTTVEEVFGLMRGAAAVIGMNSGITIMAGVFGVKTILLYHKYLFTGGVHRDFAINTFPPNTVGTTYFPEFADRSSWKEFAARAISVVSDEPYQPGLVEGVRLELPVRAEGIRNETEQDSVLVSIRDVENDANVEGEEKVITITTVFKSGGPYKEDYVRRLASCLKEHVSFRYEFLPLTDVDLGADQPRIPLKDGLPGWWSKFELFRPGLFSGTVVYFDLDTMIVGDIDYLLIYPHRFSMLRAFHPKRKFGPWGSGIMAWSGNMSVIYERFMRRPDRLMQDPRGDQLLVKRLAGREPDAIQGIQPGVYSYKRHCKDGVPEDASIVCFHGRPRPHEIGWNLTWQK